MFGGFVSCNIPLIEEILQVKTSIFLQFSSIFGPYGEDNQLICELGCGSQGICDALGFVTLAFLMS